MHGDDITVVEIGGNWIGASEPYQNGDGYFAPGRACDIDTQTLDECEPTVPELCELTGSTLAEAESLCATVCPELRDECIYDVCVFGATARPSRANARFAELRPPHAHHPPRHI